MRLKEGSPAALESVLPLFPAAVTPSGKQKEHLWSQLHRHTSRSLQSPPSTQSHRAIANKYLSAPELWILRCYPLCKMQRGFLCISRGLHSHHYLPGFLTVLNHQLEGGLYSASGLGADVSQEQLLQFSASRGYPGPNLPLALNADSASRLQALGSTVCVLGADKIWHLTSVISIIWGKYIKRLLKLYPFHSGLPCFPAARTFALPVFEQQWF